MSNGTTRKTLNSDEMACVSAVHHLGEAARAMLQLTPFKDELEEVDLLMSRLTDYLIETRARRNASDLA